MSVFEFQNKVARYLEVGNKQTPVKHPWAISVDDA